MAHVKIIPSAPSEDGYQRTQGTKVMAGGVEIERVQKITITAIPGDLWKAEIVVIAEVPPLTASAKVMLKATSRLAWLFPFLRPRQVDVTTLKDESSMWEAQ